MTNSSNITGIFSRLIELIKKRLNSTTAWETMSKPSHQIVNREGEGLTPVGYRALIRAKRDFDASIDSGEIYQVFMRLFCYLTMKERHLLYPVLCKQGPVVGIDDSTLSNISEVISNDDFCLKYKEIYDIFYNVK